MRGWTLIVLWATGAAGAARAAEVTITTADGQVLQGEDLGTENFKLQLRTRFGVIGIPTGEIETRTISQPPKVEEAPPAPPAPPEGAGAVQPDAAVDLMFPIPKAPNFVALQIARESAIPEPAKPMRQELRRDIRNFADSADLSKRRIVRQLQDCGLAAYPFVSAAYPSPMDIEIKIELLQCLAVPGRPFTASIFSVAHDSATNQFRNIMASAPQPPAAYLTKREQPATKEELLKFAALDVIRVEEYASIAGGPFNALFLLGIYKQRYGAETTDALLKDIARDRTRLAATSLEPGRVKIWTAQDKIMLAEQLLPILFEDDEDYKTLPRDLLKKLLPPGYPKWEAPEEDWVAWWKKTRPEMAKK